MEYDVHRECFGKVELPLKTYFLPFSCQVVKENAFFWEELPHCRSLKAPPLLFLGDLSCGKKGGFP